MTQADKLRPNWREYFMGLAWMAALRADCTRRRVGAVIVLDNRVVSAGYNGGTPKGPSCLLGQCPRGKSNVPPGSSYDTGPGTCIAVHAEANAIIFAGRDKCVGADLYVTDTPCDGCWRLIDVCQFKNVLTDSGKHPKWLPVVGPGWVSG